jgi:hypothetical protein
LLFRLLGHLHVRLVQHAANRAHIATAELAWKTQDVSRTAALDLRAQTGTTFQVKLKENITWTFCMGYFSIAEA